ncbi:MAG: hypothetical protein P8X53_08195 [Chromatiales bacterium]
MSENKGPHCLTPNVAMEYLRDSPLGNELDSAELDALSKNVCARELAGGEFLIEAGTSDDSVHLACARSTTAGSSAFSARISNR